ncbi:PAS domain S-box protein [bacterium]|nr:PAS domain S-box protein [bacterium]
MDKEKREALLKKVEAKRKELLELETELAEASVDGAAVSEIPSLVRHILDGLPDVSYIIDLDARIRYINPSIQRHYGHRVDELLGRTFTEFVHPDDLPVVQQNFSALFTGDSRPTQHRLLDACGRYRWARSCSTLLEEDGEAKWVYGTLIDIDSMKDLEDQLRSQESWMKAILNSLPVLVSYIDDDLTYRFANEAYRETLNTDPVGIVGRTVPDVIGEKAFQKAKVHLDRVFRGEVVEYEEVFRYAEDNVRHMHGRLLPDTDESKTVKGYYAVLNDVTRYHQTERALRESEQRFKTLFTSAKDFVFIKNDQMQYTFINPAMVDSLGLDRVQIQGKSASDFYESSTAETMREADLRVLRGETVEQEHTLTIQGKDRRFHVIKTPLPDETGSIIGLCGIARDITERNEALMRLRQSEEKYRTLIDSIQDGVFILRDGIFAFANDALADLVGYDREELHGQPFPPFIAPEDRDMVKQRHARRMRGEEVPSTYEFRLLHKDGSTRVHVNMSTSVLQFEGRPVAIGTLKDITERVRSEEKIRASEQRFIDIFEAAADGIIYTTKRARILEVNQKFCELTGLSREAVVGHSAFDLARKMLTAKDLPRILRIIADNIRRPSAQRLELEFNNKTIEVSTRSNPSHAGIAALLRDISERRQAEHAVRLLASIVESTPDAIISLNHDLKVHSWNDAAETIFGYTSKEMKDQPLDVLFTEESAESSYDKLFRAAGGERFALHEAQWQSKRGEQLTIAFSCSPLEGMSDNRTGVSLIVRDLTEYRKLERQYAHAQRLESIGRLSGGIAHDFNNLLTAITGNAELAIMALEKDHPARADVEEILSTADRAGTLTRQLLAFSKRRTAHPIPLDINHTIRSMEKMLRRMIGEDVILQLTLEPNLPAVNIDPAHLEQVLINLVVNARDAMPVGGELILDTCLVRRKTPDPNHVALRVTDSGEGMDEETRNHIFEPFFTTKSPEKGTGLGLATVYGIVQQHNGTIECSSSPGKGTTFLLEFPATEAGAQHGKSASEDDKDLHGHEKLLVVEDETHVRELVVRYLIQYGYTVTEARGSEEALKFCEQDDETFDLIITDVVMPYINGRDLVQRIRGKHPNQKVLYMSGYARDYLDTSNEPERELIHFIAKPFHPATLLATVRRLLDQE